MKTVPINGNAICDWPGFHDEFSRAFGFPEFYGRTWRRREISDPAIPVLSFNVSA